MPSRSRLLARGVTREVRGNIWRLFEINEEAAHQVDRVRRRTIAEPKFVPRIGSIETVPLASMLVGSQGGLSARRFATLSNDPGWPSLPLSESPHVRLLTALHAGEAPSADLLEATGYADLARRVLMASSHFFGASDLDGVLETVSRRLDDSPTEVARGSSTPGEPPLVRPLRFSSMVQIVDGHHRLAQAFVQGDESAVARVARQPATTPLQSLLMRMSWMEGKRELYQPIESPEISGQEWPLVRACTDRLEMMTSYLDSKGIPGRRDVSYLDVASCYGWFVAQMKERGHQSLGVERDVNAPKIGDIGYHLDPTDVCVSDALAWLRKNEQQFDVVSCFSLVHHYLMSDVNQAEELVRLLSRATRRVLFFESGQGTERWFARKLAGWDPAAVATFLRKHGDFATVEPLGTDRDGVGAFVGNYGRTLFACTR